MTEPPAAPNASTAPEIRLYTQARNPFSEKVAAALAMKGLRYERVVSDAPEDVARWSPIERTLPVLEIDGQRKADSHAIVAWLDERFPEPSLYSSDPRLAEQQRSLAEWCDDSFTFYWNRWRNARYPQPGDDAPVDDSLLARLRDRIQRRLGHAPRTRADARELEIIGQIFDRMTDLEGFLGERPFFHAEAPSIADISVYAMLRVLRDGPIPYCSEAIEERPRLAAFLDRVDGRIKSSEVGRRRADG